MTQKAVEIQKKFKIYAFKKNNHHFSRWSGYVIDPTGSNMVVP